MVFFILFYSFIYLHYVLIKMFLYDVQQRVKLIDFFFYSERSIIHSQRKFAQHFDIRVSPIDNMIRNLIARFERTGSVGDFPGSV